jgi:flagellar biosynthesis protein FlhF
MRIKSYFSRTVEDAMAQASRELGPEAILVSTRHAPPEARHLGDFEVVFAGDVPDGIAPPPDGAGAAPASVGAERLSSQVAELKKELESMRRALVRQSASSPQWLGPSPDLANAYSLLTASDMVPELAREIVDGAQARVSGKAPAAARADERVREDGFRQALVEEMESRITAEPFLGRGDSRPRIAALVGPPGSGKTTTLVKLAVNYGLAARRPVLLLSLDTYRIGAAEQLRSYAAILGVGFQVLETVTALAQTIEENRGKELIFIDTAGLDPGDEGRFPGFPEWLATRSDIDTHLVLPAFMKPSDLTRVVDAFEAYQPQRLLFTRLDETGSFGPVFNEAVRTGKPLSFFATGQRIPEDLETASGSRLAELVLGGQSGRARSAA